jgi:ABC-type transport system substrate-binding protein
MLQRRRLIATTGAVLALATAACGGSSGSSGSSTTVPIKQEVGLPTTIATSTPTTIRTTTTGAPTTIDPVLGEGRPQFVALAIKLGAFGSDSDLLALGDAACEFAKLGPAALRSYILTVVEPTFARGGAPTVARRNYVFVLGAAGIKLCPLQLATLQPEVQRLSGN